MLKNKEDIINLIATEMKKMKLEGVFGAGIVGSEVPAGHVGKEFIVDKNNRIAFKVKNPHPDATTYPNFASRPTQSTYQDENGDTQYTIQPDETIWIGTAGNMDLWKWVDAGAGDGSGAWVDQKVKSTHTKHWRKMTAADANPGGKFSNTKTYRLSKGHDYWYAFFTGNNGSEIRFFQYLTGDRSSFETVRIVYFTGNKMWSAVTLNKSSSVDDIVYTKNLTPQEAWIEILVD